MRWLPAVVVAVACSLAGSGTSAQGPVRPIDEQGRVREAILERMVRDHGYGLTEGQAVKHIAQPVPAMSHEFYFKGQEGSIARGPGASFFRYRDGRLVRWGNTFQDRSKGYTLGDLIDAFFGLKGRMVEGSPAFLQRHLPGDWVILDSALELPGEAPGQLKAILNQDFQLDVDLEFREVERPVIAVRGIYRYSPTRLDAEAENADPARRDVLRIFEDEQALDLRPMASGDSDFGVFLTWLGESVDAIVLDEREQQTEAQTIAWRRHPTAADLPARDRGKADSAAILKNLERQTGLTFTREFRPVKVLFVTPGEAKPDGSPK